MPAKTYKTEVVQTRITPIDKMKITQKVSMGQFSSQADFFNTALNLLIKDGSGLFANISRHFDASYRIDLPEQYAELKETYDSLKNALDALTKLTDEQIGHVAQSAPNEYKDVIRDYLLPRVTQTLKEYEDRNHLLLENRYTEPDNIDDYE